MGIGEAKFDFAGKFPNLAGWLGLLARLYPFTWPGTFLFAISIYLIGEAYNGGNVYAFIFSSGAFLILMFLSALGRLQAFRLSRLNLVWDTSRIPVAGDPTWQQVLHIGDASAFFFYRIHFRITGDFRIGPDRAFRLKAESAISGGGEVALPVHFPVSGKLEAIGALVIRDVFGLTRAALEPSERRTVSVRPPIGDQESKRRYNSLHDDESKRNQRTAEEEKYYMRGYQPGDRMKDINWKASFRVMDLITRINPVSREESRLLHIEFRHYRDDGNMTAESLYHLEFLKRWLLSFIYHVKKSYPDYRFRIVSADGPRLVETDQDLEVLALYLGGIGFVPYSKGYDEGERGPRDRFVFTTGFDRRPPSVSPGGKIRMFRTVRGKGERKFRISDLFSPDLRPGPGLLKWDRKPTGTLSGQETEVVEEKIRVLYL